MSQAQPEGYLATPSTGSGSPVLVLHPWWGLNATIKVYCDRLAQAGFLVFAPDLFHGTVVDQISDAEALVEANDGAQTKTAVAEAAKYLRERAGQAKLGVVGFSFGAYYALDLSASDPEHVRSVVLYYGTGPADFNQSQAEYLAHFAENDPYEPQDSVEWLTGEIQQAGKPLTVYTYPNTGHWFAESDRPDAYDTEAAALAWDRTVEFLKRNS